MPKVQTISTYRRRILLKKVLEVNIVNIRPCTEYEKGRYPGLYKIGTSSDRYIECIRRNRSGYSLTPVAFNPLGARSGDLPSLVRCTRGEECQGQTRVTMRLTQLGTVSMLSA